MEVRILNQHSNWLCIIVALSYPHAAHEGFRFRIPKFRFSSPSRQMRLWLRATDANLKRKHMVSDFQCRTWSLELHCTMDQRAQDFPWIFTSNVISAPPLISFAVLFRWSRKKTCLSNSTIHAYENAYLHMRYGKVRIFFLCYNVCHILQNNKRKR